MSGRDYDLVDRVTGDVVVRVRHMFPPDPADCCMCGKPTYDHWAVPFYCAPVLEGESEGGYRAACAPCYKRWEKWNDKHVAGRDEYASWFTKENSMTPTHKPEDGDRAPISNGGAELETVAWLCEPRSEGWNDHAPKWKMATTDKYVAEHPDNPYWKPTEELVRRTDATALLVEKAQRIERLESLLKVFGRELELAQRLDQAMDGEPDPAKEQRLRLIDAALSQPHPHGG